MSTPRCTSCGYVSMTHTTDHTEQITVGSFNEVVAGLSGWFCPECGDGWLDDESSHRFGSAGDELVEARLSDIVLKKYS